MLSPRRLVRWSVRVTLVGVSLATGPAFGADVVVHQDVAYKTGAALSDYELQNCRLDLYLPDGDTGFPVIVWFHGGGMTAGDKADSINVDVARSLAARGIGVASVNYRLSPAATFPAYVEDAAAAVAWVLEHIDDYRGDPERVFVSGHSAGGYLVAMVGLDERYLAARGHALTALRGLIPISGQMVTHATVRTERGLPASRPVVDAAAPLYHVRADAPPVLAIAGSEDIPARPEENRYLVAALRSVGHPDATYIEVEGRTHGSIIGLIPEAGDPVADAIVAFIERHSGSDD